MKSMLQAGNNGGDSKPSDQEPDLQILHLLLCLLLDNGVVGREEDECGPDDGG